MNAIWLAFLTGLTTGGLSCLAVQGGLVTSAVAQQGDQTPSLKKWHIVGLFLAAKVAVYTLLGFLLGSLGSTLTLSPKFLGYTQIIVGLFLLATAARIADLHPIFRYFVVQPPSWIYRWLKQTSKNGSWFAPILLGFLTVFMPCGVTQAMMVTAVASGSPLMGAGLMFAFTLGTSPIFFALGLAVVELLQRKLFAYVAACIVAIFGVFSLNGGMALTGSVWTMQNVYKAATTNIDDIAGAKGSVAGVTADGKQDVLMNVTSRGYNTTTNTLKKGVPVHLTLNTSNTSGCSRAFTIPDLNISKVLPETGTEVVEFTPTKEGRLAYSCAMGMYTGSFDVIP